MIECIIEKVKIVKVLFFYNIKKSKHDINYIFIFHLMFKKNLYFK